MRERPSVAIAGSGLAGLACAAALAGTADVTLFERLPVIGGECWEDDVHVRLRDQARSRGARFAAGTQVLRWEGDRLLAIGEYSGVHRAGALVVATGHRPRTRAESGIDGTRTGGVLAATVASHLQAQGVRLGRDVVILGAGRWAREVAEASIGSGVRTCMVAGDSTVFPDGVEVLRGARIVRTHGMPRITSLELSDGHRTWKRTCDSLVLADGHVPYRNIDGAVFEAPGVVFAQHDDEETWNPVHAGEAAAANAREMARSPWPHQFTTTRIGCPH